jgi:adenylate kinase family enzyme
MVTESLAEGHGTWVGHWIGEGLMQKPDDNKEFLAKRMTAYHEQTSPILDYYNTEKNILFTANAMKEMPEVKGCITAKDFMNDFASKPSYLLFEWR